MQKLDSLLDKHIRAIHQEFKRIPKSQKHIGPLALIMNKLEDSKAFVERAEKIVNTESTKMTDFINQNYLNDYSDAEINKFIKKAKAKFTDAINKGLREAFG